MVGINDIGSVHPWERLLEFAHLPEGGAVLCVGERSTELAAFLEQGGHPAVGVSLAADGAPVGAPAGAVSLVSDSEAWGVRSDAFAAVVLIDLFHRQKDPEATLAEARRVAGAGCLLLIQEPVAEGPDSDFLSIEEFCAHLAGEGLGVLAHRQVEDNEGTWALWLLRVPRETPERPRTSIQEGR